MNELNVSSAICTTSRFLSKIVLVKIKLDIILFFLFHLELIGSFKMKKQQ